MNKYRIMFSPTGGTEKVAKAITKEWDNVEDIDHFDSKEYEMLLSRFSLGTYKKHITR